MTRSSSPRGCTGSWRKPSMAPISSRTGCTPSWQRPSKPMPLEVMRVPKEPKTKPLAMVEPPAVNPIPEPGRLISHFMSTAKVLGSAFAAAYDSVKPVAADHEKEVARIRGILQSHGPDWNFSATGQTYSVSRQLSQLSGQAIYAVGAYVH